MLATILLGQASTLMSMVETDVLVSALLNPSVQEA